MHRVVYFGVEIIAATLGIMLHELGRSNAEVRPS